MAQHIKPFALPIDEVAQLYATDITFGLTYDQAKNRLRKYGPNKLRQTEQIGYHVIFLHQFKSPLIYVLLLAGLISAITGHFLDALFILCIVFLNAIIGAFQEAKAYATLESLKNYLVKTCTVIRNNKKYIINAQDVVIGDIILLRSGERVPADARIVDAANIKVDEAVLTGESGAVKKKSAPVLANTPVYEQQNMLFSGTYILWGTAQAIVTATGIHTQLGKIQQAVQDVSTKTPLQKQIGALANNIVMSGVIVWIILLILGFLLGKNFIELFMLFTALMVSAIPEGLPIVVTVVLAMGAYVMAKKNVLIKRLEAVEGLSRTDVIVTDKTGTLTRNEMTVLEVFAGGKYFKVTGEGYHNVGAVYFQDRQLTHDDLTSSKNQIFHELYLLVLGSALIGKTFVEYNRKTKQFVVKGEPLEAAVTIFAQKLGFTSKILKQKFIRIAEMPFDIDLRLQISAFQQKTEDNNHTILLYVMGSPEGIMESSPDTTPEDKHALEKFLDKGLRLIALSYKKISYSQWTSDQEKYADIIDQLKSYLGSLTFLGICGIQDAIRTDVKNVIIQARNSGLAIVMATGDHLKTAKFVGTQVGIYKKGDYTLTDEQFARLSDTDVLKHLDRLTICARFSPIDKQRLIKLYHKQHKIVAMTGDGVNDSPSLVAADLGIAMGVSGSEVAKEASDMILLDDSFTSIIKAIEVGRHIFYALRRIIAYLFATNLSEILVITSAFLLLQNDILPLLPAQILWLNLVTDGFLDIALGLELPESNLLHKDIFNTIKNRGLLDLSQVLKILYLAVYMAVISLVVFVVYKPYGAEYARSMTLLMMAVFQWVNAWNCRSERTSIFQLGLLTNKPLLVATGIVIALQILAIYLPFFHLFLHTVPLTASDWFYALSLGITLLLIEELRKFLAYRISNK